jgi:predicted amidophosphoribosyltransferase
MEGHCGKCGAQLEPAWSFCPLCGTAKTQEALTPAVPGAAEKAPVRGAFSGLALGMIAAPILIIVGTMLCLTGLGAFLGIPMIIAAIFAPVLGPAIGFGALKGKCPWCNAPVSSIRSMQSFDCDTCKQRIVVRLGRFVRVD